MNSTPEKSLFQAAVESTDMEPLLAGVPGAVRRVIDESYGPEADRVLSEIAYLTVGFEGVLEEQLADVTPNEIAEVLACAGRSVSVIQLCDILEELFGWPLDVANVPNENEDNLVGHGHVLCTIESGLFDEPAPVVLHAGRIDPGNPGASFAFSALQLAATKRFEGRPCMILPMDVHMQGAAGETEIGTGGLPEAVLVVAGFVFDGSDWFPVTFGAQESDPMANSVPRAVHEPGSVQIVSGPLFHEGETLPVVAAGAILQSVFDRYTDATVDNPDPPRPDPARDYVIIRDREWFRFEQGRGVLKG